MDNRGKELLINFQFYKYHFRSIYGSNDLLFHKENHTRQVILIHSTKRTKICVHRFAHTASMTVISEHHYVAISLLLLGQHYQEE